MKLKNQHFLGDQVNRAHVYKRPPKDNCRGTDWGLGTTLKHIKTKTITRTLINLYLKEGRKEI